MKTALDYDNLRNKFVKKKVKFIFNSIIVYFSSLYKRLNKKVWRNRF